MSENERRKQDAQTYRRRDLSCDSKQDPDDALKNKHHIGEVVSIQSERTATIPPVSKEEVPSQTYSLFEGGYGTSQRA